MNDGMNVAKQATNDIEHWLRLQPETVNIQNVESDPAFQKIDVDLIWMTTTGNLKVEIKGDRYHKTGNFFFETHSNFEKGTPGCFLYTQADWLFYYFVTPRILYLLPMPITKNWFLLNKNRFKERSTRTTVRNHYYTTVGRLVPITEVLKHIPGIRKVEI